MGIRKTINLGCVKIEYYDSLRIHSHKTYKRKFNYQYPKWLWKLLHQYLGIYWDINGDETWFTIDEVYETRYDCCIVSG